ncbi:YccT family protein [Agarivorans sp. QJM3NY_25]|uniref:YccT family protein n=1 Tax=Agarivorans sp. QJM3NY_25 TaxID=3421430 RepID=UPI003D7D9048
MRFLVKAVTLTCACLASWSALAASFSTPNHFELMYVDKQSVGVLSLNKSNVELPTGQHQVVVRYSDNIGSNNNSELVKSSPIVINIELKKGQEIFLESKQPNTLSRAKSFAKKPQFTLKDQHGGTVNASHYILPKKSGLQLSRNYLNEIAAIEAQQAKANPVAASTVAVAETTTRAATPAPAAKPVVMNSATGTAVTVATTSAATAAVTIPSNTDASDNTELQMLQFWYQRADATTRKQFQIWVIQQQ